MVQFVKLGEKYINVESITSFAEAQGALYVYVGETEYAIYDTNEASEIFAYLKTLAIDPTDKVKVDAKGNYYYDDLVEPKIDPSQPAIDNDGNIQLRLLALMEHPDYNIDLAFGGKGEIGYNRNAELDQMSIVDLIIDAKQSIEQDIDSGGKYAGHYGYAGFMSGTWQRAIESDLVIDEHYNRSDYIKGDTYYKGLVALNNRRKTMSQG